MKISAMILGAGLILSSSVFAANADQAAIDTLQQQIKAQEATFNKSLAAQQATTQKAISTLQTQIQGQIAHLQTEIQQMQSQLTNEIKQVQSEMMNAQVAKPAEAPASKPAPTAVKS